jgi:hypothetical protein
MIRAVLSPGLADRVSVMDKFSSARERRLPAGSRRCDHVKQNGACDRLWFDRDEIADLVRTLSVELLRPSLH